MPVAEHIKELMSSSSFIRKMFEEGIQMKARYGDDNVYDFSIGNPDLEPPEEVKNTVKKLSLLDEPGIHGYMPNAGYKFAREAMAEAVEKADAMCLARTGEPVGYVLFDAMQIKTVAKPQESLIKGDSRVLAIAAASIIAKVTRDRQMRLYDQQYPGYGFAANKGYGTKAHYEGLRKSGLTPIHRRTFLKNILHDD